MMWRMGFNHYQEHKKTGINWIEEIPATWKTMKAKFLLAESNIRSVSGEEDLLSLSKYHGVIRKDQMSERAGQAESLVGYKEVQAGDLVINKMQASNGLMAVSQVTGITSPDYAIYKVRKNGAARIDYICHVLRQPEYLAEIKRRAKGVMEGFIRLYTDDLFDIPIILPPLNEQQSILDFLDDKCAKIEEAVKIKEDQITLLRERRQITIQDTVTRGLNPATLKKDSHASWLGEVPTDWQVGPGRICIYENKDKNTGMKESNVLSLSYGRVIIKDEDKMTGLVPESYETYQIVQPGDIIIRGTDLQNDVTSLRTGLAKDHGIITSAYINLRPKPNADAEFLHYLLHSYDVKKVFYGLGSGLRQNLSYVDFKYLTIPLPSIKEQRAIVEFLDKECAKVDRGIEMIRRQIAALKEYKTSLINAAVTGKIKVI